MPYSVYLKKGEERDLLDGHSRVYANEVERIEGKDKNGSLATVYTHDGRFMGKGYINHLSKILVRVFLRKEDETDDKQFYLTALSKADEMRKSLGFDNCYRLVFSEADGLPALIVDRYADILVVQCTSLGIDRRKALIAECLVELFHPKGIYERSDVAIRAKEGLSEAKGVLYGEVPDRVLTVENSIKLSVDVKNGQKTGYFLDQKENRLTARRFCAGKDVLDCFCNIGGFSLNAATCARNVTAVDISQTALENVVLNASLNGFDNIETLQGDVFETLRTMRGEGRKFGTVILDPPAFCKSAAEVKDAYRGYKDINILGMKLVEQGGFLVTCSCSQHMTLTLFERMLQDAARESGRRARLVHLSFQSPDHPFLPAVEETRYLKFAVLALD